MPSDYSAMKNTHDADLDLAKQSLAKIKNAFMSETAGKVVETTIYDLDEFWVVRDRPPYFV